MAFGSVNVGQAKADDSKYIGSDRVGVPLGLATLGADGKVTKSQMPEIDAYTKRQTDDLVDGDVAAHNADASAHGDIRAAVASAEAAIKALELKYGTDITGNPFSVGFATLDGVVVTGVWNAALGRIEF